MSLIHQLTQIITCGRTSFWFGIRFPCSPTISTVYERFYRSAFPCCSIIENGSFKTWFQFGIRRSRCSTFSSMPCTPIGEATTICIFIRFNHFLCRGTESSGHGIAVERFITSRNHISIKVMSHSGTLIITIL